MQVLLGYYFCPLLMRPLNLEWAIKFFILQTLKYMMYFGYLNFFFSSTGIYQVSVMGILYFYLQMEIQLTIFDSRSSVILYTFRSTLQNHLVTLPQTSPMLKAYYVIHPAGVNPNTNITRTGISRIYFPIFIPGCQCTKEI